MKVAVSLLDNVFKGAERLAPDEVTEAMGRVCAEVGDPDDHFNAAAAHRTLSRTEW